MTVFKSLLFACLTVLTTQAPAEVVPEITNDQIPYIKMSTCDLGPFKSLRDYWDQTGTFCFVRDHEEFKYQIQKMGEIKLRESGRSMFGEYYNALSAENRRIVDEYDTYYVRYLAFGEGKIGQTQSFVTQVFFSWGGSTQTIYAFGEIGAAGEVRLTGFSSSQSIERDYRTAYNTIKNIFSIFRGRNPVNVGQDEAMNKDRRRIRPAADVIQQYQGKDQPSPKADIPKL